MRRILICVAYDGTDYSGWQYQEGEATIEGELNKALSELCNEEITVIGASRTDAGVHSLSSMAVFDTNSTIPAERFAPALKTKLPEDIAVSFSKEVPLDFHPRHTLTEKTYEYHIWNDGFCPPTKRRYVISEERELDVKAMDTAAKLFIGEHDFKSFCSVHTTAETTVRNLTDAKVYRDGSEVIISVSGNGFLYNMVRIIAGTLLQVGVGTRSVDEVKMMLDACDRTKSGPTAPAKGLILKDFKFLQE